MSLNKKQLKSSTSEKKKTNPYKKDAIVDQMGQWKYPGQNTKIMGDSSGTHITMQGVDYPVFAKDNLGNQQMMYPGQEYFFPGSSVTEYPMMQEGGGIPFKEHKPDLEETLIRPAERLSEINIEENYFKKGIPVGDPLNQGADALRHAGTSMYFADNIQRHLPPPFGYIASNVAGLAHEGKVAYDAIKHHKKIPWNEMWMDIINNEKGAFIGSLPTNTKRKEELLKDIYKKGALHQIEPNYDQNWKEGLVDVFKKGGQLKLSRRRKTGASYFTEYPQIPKAQSGVEVAYGLDGQQTLVVDGKHYTEQNFVKKFGQEWWDEFAKPTPTPVVSNTLPEVVIKSDYEPDRIRLQKEIALDNKPKGNFSIIDKGENSIYYYNKKGELQSKEDIITGKSNKDKDYGLSMSQWFEENDTDDHDAYFKYLSDNQYQTTPSGIFTVGKMRENIAQNPDKYGDWYNQNFRPERAKEIYDRRTKDYGPLQKLITFKSEYGIPSSKAIHGTGNQKRIDAFNTPGSDLNLSNGCINVNGKSYCFDNMKKGDQLYILPEEDPHKLLYPRNKSDKRIKNQKNIVSTRNKVYQAMIDSGLEPDPESLAFITAVAEKESSGGKSKFMKIEKNLPYSIASSQGAFQINPETFAKYLPEDYSTDFNSQVKAVHNFYNMEKSNTEAMKNPMSQFNKTEVPAELYRKYSGDSKGMYTPKFKRLYQTALTAYENGGIPLAGTGRQIDPEIAMQALEDDEIRGRALTPRQRAFFEEIVAMFTGEDPDDDFYEEYRKGGQPDKFRKSGLSRRKTDKNLQSSINELFLRNYLTHGPSGRNIYSPLPRAQDGTLITEDNFLDDLIAQKPTVTVDNTAKNFNYLPSNYPMTRPEIPQLWDTDNWKTKQIKDKLIKESKGQPTVFDTEADSWVEANNYLNNVARMKAAEPKNAQGYATGQADVLAGIDDPILNALTFGTAGAMKAVGPLAKTLEGLRGGIGGLTYGASEIPFIAHGLTNAALKGTVKGISNAKNFAKREVDTKLPVIKYLIEDYKQGLKIPVAEEASKTVPTKLNPIELKQLDDINYLSSLKREPTAFKQGDKGITKEKLAEAYLKSSLDDNALLRLTGKPRAFWESEVNAVNEAKKSFQPPTTSSESIYTNPAQTTLDLEIPGNPLTRKFETDIGQIPGTMSRRQYLDGESNDYLQYFRDENYTPQQIESYLGRLHYNPELVNTIKTKIAFSTNPFVQNNPFIQKLIKEGALNLGQKTRRLVKTPKDMKSFLPLVPEEMMYGSKAVIPSLFKLENQTNGEILRQVKRAIDQVKVNPPGLYHAAGSLSSNSAPMYYKIASKLKDPNLDFKVAGFTNLNDSGFLNKAGIPQERITEYLNNIINNLRFNNKKIPSAYWQDGQIYAPNLLIEKKGIAPDPLDVLPNPPEEFQMEWKFGGSLPKAQNGQSTDVFVRGPKPQLFQNKEEQQYQIYLKQREDERKRQEELVRQSKTKPNVFNNFRSQPLLTDKQGVVADYDEAKARQERINSQTNTAMGLGALTALSVAVPPIGLGLGAAGAAHAIPEIPETIHSWSDPTKSKWDATKSTLSTGVGLMGALPLVGSVGRASKVAQSVNKAKPVLGPIDNTADWVNWGKALEEEGKMIREAEYALPPLKPLPGEKSWGLSWNKTPSSTTGNEAFYQMLKQRFGERLQKNSTPLISAGVGNYAPEGKHGPILEELLYEPSKYDAGFNLIGEPIRGHFAERLYQNIKDKELVKHSPLDYTFTNFYNNMDLDSFGNEYLKWIKQQPNDPGIGSQLGFLIDKDHDKFAEALKLVPGKNTMDFVPQYKDWGNSHYKTNDINVFLTEYDKYLEMLKNLKSKSYQDFVQRRSDMKNAGIVTEHAGNNLMLEPNLQQFSFIDLLPDHLLQNQWKISETIKDPAAVGDIFRPLISPGARQAFRESPPEQSNARIKNLKGVVDRIGDVTKIDPYLSNDTKRFLNKQYKTGGNMQTPPTAEQFFNFGINKPDQFPRLLEKGGEYSPGSTGSEFLDERRNTLLKFVQSGTQKAIQKEAEQQFMGQFQTQENMGMPMAQGGRSILQNPWSNYFGNQAKNEYDQSMGIDNSILNDNFSLPQAEEDKVNFQGNYAGSNSTVIDPRMLRRTNTFENQLGINNSPVQQPTVIVDPSKTIPGTYTGIPRQENIWSSGNYEPENIGISGLGPSQNITKPYEENFPQQIPSNGPNVSEPTTLNYAPTGSSDNYKAPDKDGVNSGKPKMDQSGKKSDFDWMGLVNMINTGVLNMAQLAENKKMDDWRKANRPSPDKWSPTFQSWRGDYSDGYRFAGNNFRPDQYNQGMYGNIGKFGGQFKDGGQYSVDEVVDMDPDQIAQFLKMGGTLEYC